MHEGLDGVREVREDRLGEGVGEDLLGGVAGGAGDGGEGGEEGEAGCVGVYIWGRRGGGRGRGDVGWEEGVDGGRGEEGTVED